MCVKDIIYNYLLEDSKKLKGKSKKPKYFLNIFTESNVYTVHSENKNKINDYYILHMEL